MKKLKIEEANYVNGYKDGDKNSGLRGQQVVSVEVTVHFVHANTNTGTESFLRGQGCWWRWSTDHCRTSRAWHCRHVGIPEFMWFNLPRLDVRSLLTINWYSLQSAVTFENAVCAKQGHLLSVWKMEFKVKPTLGYYQWYGFTVFFSIGFKFYV